MVRGHQVKKQFRQMQQVARPSCSGAELQLSAFHHATSRCSMIKMHTEDLKDPSFASEIHWVACLAAIAFALVPGPGARNPCGG